MTDYISKTLLLHDIAVVASLMDDPIKVYDQMSAIVKESPAADVAERKHGKWERTDAYPHRVYCSACYETYLPNETWLELWHPPMSFCPNCGAQMGSEGE